LKGLTLIEIASDATLDQVKKSTEAPFQVSQDLQPMQQ
jgi:acyl CoA:acetate/3-ketoacid CoA transferase beta subunit